MSLRRTLGMLVAPVLLVVGAAGAASAASADGPTVNPDGTRVTTPAPAHTAPAPGATPRTGNDGAWVSGVGQCDIASHSDCWANIDPVNGTPCPDGHFCIYTGQYAAEGGKIFSFYHCANGSGGDWALHGWNGTGYYHNSNSGGAHGYLKDVNHNVLLDSWPDSSGPYDFAPVWYLRAC